MIADCDLGEGLKAKRWFDAVGHYAARTCLAARPRSCEQARR